MKEEHINEIKAILILAIGMILLASLISFVPEDLPWYTSHPNIPAKNLIRVTGAYVAGSLFFVIGYSAYFLVVFLFFWAWNKFSLRKINFTISKFISAIVLFVVVSSLFSMIGPQESVSRFSRAGIIGIIVSDSLVKYLGAIGAYIILLSLCALALISTGEVLLSPLLIKIKEWLQGVSQTPKEKKEEKKLPIAAVLKPKINLSETIRNKFKKKEEDQKLATDSEEKVLPKNGAKAQPSAPPKPQIRIAPMKTEESSAAEKDDMPKFVGDYQLPSLDLLRDSPTVSTSKIQSNLVSGAKTLEETLLSFNVQARVVDIERGPAITRYELEPAPGVKVQKFTTLADDIALAMRASTVRVVAPIPGKNRVGIEVPNEASASIYLKDVLNCKEFKEAGSKLTLAFGKDIGGKPMIADLAEMPHLLIAGTTGSGKSVCVNSIIMSILFNATPDEVKFVMVDPKMVELAMYNDIPHLLCPTVTDTKKASAVLNWVVGEMESRYRKLSKAGAKNIKGYNEKGNNMPYIVVIIDELADLMQVAAKGVEGAIMRLAQLSRAVGIHLILATQRPSVNVITGVIKANFPARISFKVASKVDSRTVLDMNGAETLLGKGDMLFVQPGDAKPTRGQGNFVADDEITRVIDFIRKQGEPQYDETILAQNTATASGSMDEKDEFYDEAVRLVMETNQASVSILQRRLRLGYTRAARLIDMMEQAGLVGPYVGSKPREIVIDREQWLLQNMTTKEENTGNESS